MRDILFRGKRVDNGEWCYGGLYRVLDLSKNDGSVFAAYITGEVEQVVMIKVIPETVGQFVGVADNNMINIYEDDIVQGYWSWMKGDGYLKKGYPQKIRKWFKVEYDIKWKAGFDIREIKVHPEDQFAADEYFYRSIQCSLREDRECELKDNKVQWKGKCDSLEIIGNIHDNPELLTIK